MESGTTQSTREAKLGVSETENVADTDSAESFQSFIYDLFEKNGILNDLRAYLRGHIVNVLKSAQTGDPPACQKNFTQRLDLKYQALNMLVAEYLMRLEFSYSFSVFVSEIPLANMVFGFAKSLMEKVNDNSSEIRFKEADVWSILNYLGVQCDSEYAAKIIHMYNSEPQNPLLLCLLKGMPMYKECVSPHSPSGVSVDSSKYCESADMETHIKDSMPEYTHCGYCKKCQSKMYKVKERYKRKKKYLAKMFQQMKSVYETEVQMVKAEEQKKVEQSIATHSVQMQRKRNELEQAFKSRELELERSVQHKKKFLWGLARSLRDQHLHMTRAMHNVRAETERLELKEDSLKTQLAEAEHILKKRGQEMRAQISNELALLEAHLSSMKRERENITRESSELQTMKSIQDSSSKVPKVNNLENEEVHSHYDLLKNELNILKTYLESSQMQAKCVIERGTMTEITAPVSQTFGPLNNRQGNEKGAKTDDLDERVILNQLVNDFKKKNVNFCPSNLDEIYERRRDRSHSSNSSEAGGTVVPDLDLEVGRDRDRDRDLIQRLREENDRLKTFARQRCVAPARPRTAPASPPASPPARLQHMLNETNSISASNLNVGWRKGAGEELSMFSNAQPRILVPGDTLPFIGVLMDRHGNNRRPRALRGVGVRAASPVRRRARAASPVRMRERERARETERERGREPERKRERNAPVLSGAGSSAQGRVTTPQLPEASCSVKADEETNSLSCGRPHRARKEVDKNSDKSPESSLKEAKETSRRKDSNQGSTVSSREMSPTSVLREAKLRLRKLELEAEAVEQSYRDFRRRQTERRACKEPHDVLAKPLDITRSHSEHELDAATKNDIETHFAELQKSVRADFDKYMLDYKTKFDIGKKHFRNKPTVSEKVKPIPDTFEVDRTEQVRSYYLGSPLTEFRKLYTSARQSRQGDTDTKTLNSGVNSVTNAEVEYEISARNDALQKVKHSKQAELQILKRNIDQMYNSPNHVSALTVEQTSQASAEEENNLAADSISEMNDINSQAPDMLLVVQSTVSNKVASEVFSAHMTIIVSPKWPASPRSPSPEQAARLTRTDVLDAIFHADARDVSSVHVQLALSNDVSGNDYDKGDYPADVPVAPDYSHSGSSRISVPAMDGGDMAEDDNLWDP